MLVRFAPSLSTAGMAGFCAAVAYLWMASGPAPAWLSALESLGAFLASLGGIWLIWSLAVPGEKEYLLQMIQRTLAAKEVAI